MEQSEHLPGGSGGVWRVRAPDGEIRVHRPTGPWTPAVHELLRYLGEQGLDGIPEVYGLDDEGREVLSYLPGDTLDPAHEEASDSALGDAAAWLRRFHDAVAGFEPSHTTWRQGEASLDRIAGQIVCHNDPGLYNWVVVEGEFAGMIDWDRAGPGLPVDDLAFLCWSGIPLLRETPSEKAARRLALAAEAYGGVSVAELLDAVVQRMELIAERWRFGIASGDPGTIALRDSGMMDVHEKRVAGFIERLPALRAAALERSGRVQHRPLGWTP